MKVILYEALKRFDNKEIEKSGFEIISLDEIQFGNNDFLKLINSMSRSLIQVILPNKYNEIFNKLSHMEFETILEEERNIIKTQIKQKKKNNMPYGIEEIQKEIIGGILNCIILVTVHEQSYSNINLTYQDIDFFKNQNWNTDLMSTFPGMAFWLAKYYSFYTDLMTKKTAKDCFITKDNQISFWYFQLRVISNIQTFKYNCYGCFICNIYY